MIVVDANRKKKSRMSGTQNFNASKNSLFLRLKLLNNLGLFSETLSFFAIDLTSLCFKVQCQANKV